MQSQLDIIAKLKLPKPISTPVGVFGSVCHTLTELKQAFKLKGCKVIVLSENIKTKPLDGVIYIAPSLKTFSFNSQIVGKKSSVVVIDTPFALSNHKIPILDSEVPESFRFLPNKLKSLSKALSFKPIYLEVQNIDFLNTLIDTVTSSSIISIYNTALYELPNKAEVVKFQKWFISELFSVESPVEPLDIESIDVLLDYLELNVGYRQSFKEISVFQKEGKPIPYEKISKANKVEQYELNYFTRLAYKLKLTSLKYQQDGSLKS
jgi:hypothetical protein